MITKEQEKMLEYNDRQVKNYHKIQFIKKKREQEEQKKIIDRRKSIKEEIKEKFKNRPIMMGLASESRIIDKSTLTEEQIEAEIEYGFESCKN